MILAAGMGKRLGKHTQDHTKGMVEVNGITLIERAIKALNKQGIIRIVIVLGYKGDKLTSFLKEKFSQLDLVFVNNPIYDTTNNIYSLWLAKQFLTEEDTILLESDVIFEDDILEGLIESRHRTLAVVAKYESWMDGTVTLIDEEDNILFRKKVLTGIRLHTIIKRLIFISFPKSSARAITFRFWMHILKRWGIMNITNKY